MRLETSPDVLAAHLSGEAVLLNLNDKSYYRLNETAAIVWAAIEKKQSREEILQLLTSQYEIGTDDARRDMNRVIDDMKSRNLVIEKADDLAVEITVR